VTPRTQLCEALEQTEELMLALEPSISGVLVASVCESVNEAAAAGTNVHILTRVQVQMYKY
jgi:hypothetical protein